MATRAREGPAKERRGISPTFPRHTGTAAQCRSPNPSPGRPSSTHDSVSSEKHIPNYLRPTVSSAGLDHDHLHQGKKASSASGAAHKPSLSRRRSLDKPRPPHVLKAQISPNPKERNLQSSSSFTSKSTTGTSQKTFSDRLLKSQKDAARKQGSYPRPMGVKKSSIATKKQHSESSSSTIKAAPIAISSSEFDNPDMAADIPQPREEEPRSIVNHEEVVLNAGSNCEMPAEIVHVEDEEHIDHQQAEPETRVDEEIKSTESSPVAVNPAASGTTAMEEPEEPEHQNSPAEEANIDNQESVQVVNESSVDSSIQRLFGEPKAADQEKVEAEDASEEISDKKEEAIDESQVDNSKETEEVENAVKEEVKQETENVVAERALPVLARKESSVSNDVIEETASKLREQRKNKVKALAGAFETVISLQDPK